MKEEEEEEEENNFKKKKAERKKEYLSGDSDGRIFLVSNWAIVRIAVIENNGNRGLGNSSLASLVDKVLKIASSDLDFVVVFRVFYFIFFFILFYFVSNFSFAFLW